MKPFIRTLLAVLPMLPACASQPATVARPAVDVVVAADQKRVDVSVDDQPFTAYVWPDSQMKPLLFPIRSDGGTIITRGYPLDPRPDDSTDHPHHVGLWFNFGDVDGFDFWNHSDASPDKAKMGTVVHTGIRAARGGDVGELSVSAEWRRPDGAVLLDEQTDFTFQGGKGRRAIDRVSTLTARDRSIPFTDNKEGVLGLRLARSLQHPGKNEEPGVSTGLYTTSEGKTGDEAWGTRARWVMLTGVINGKDVTLAILDHPKNPGHPTYWHARGYGLFAANPFGASIFTKGEHVMNFALSPGAPVRIGYRILILSRKAQPADIEAEWKLFSAGAE